MGLWEHFATEFGFCLYAESGTSTQVDFSSRMLSRAAEKNERVSRPVEMTELLELPVHCWRWQQRHR